MTSANTFIYADLNEDGSLDVYGEIKGKADGGFEIDGRTTIGGVNPGTVRIMGAYDSSAALYADVSEGFIHTDAATNLPLYGGVLTDPENQLYRGLLSGDGFIVDISGRGHLFVWVDNELTDTLPGDFVDVGEVRGPRGLDGPQGPIGPIGPTGMTGTRGHTGHTGPIGTGPTGETGQTGQTGERGHTGFTGEKGQSGEKGETGPTGQKGDTGEKGVMGEQGHTGVTGMQGPQGIEGLQGLMGPTGMLDGTIRESLLPLNEEINIGSETQQINKLYVKDIISSGNATLTLSGGIVNLPAGSTIDGVPLNNVSFSEPVDLPEGSTINGVLINSGSGTFDLSGPIDLAPGTTIDGLPIGSLRIQGYLNSIEELPQDSQFLPDGLMYFVKSDIYMWNSNDWVNLGPNRGHTGTTGRTGQTGHTGYTDQLE